MAAAARICLSCGRTTQARARRVDCDVVARQGVSASPVTTRPSESREESSTVVPFPFASPAPQFPTPPAIGALSSHERPHSLCILYDEIIFSSFRREL